MPGKYNSVVVMSRGPTHQSMVKQVRTKSYESQLGARRMHAADVECSEPVVFPYFSLATTNSGAHNSARLISESGNVQIALDADSA